MLYELRSLLSRNRSPIAVIRRTHRVSTSCAIERYAASEARLSRRFRDERRPARLYDECDLELGWRPFSPPIMTPYDGECAGSLFAILRMAGKGSIMALEAVFVVQ